MNPNRVTPTDIPKGKFGDEATKDSEIDQTSSTQEKLTTFAGEVSILGLKQSTNPNYSPIRRLIWLCFVLIGFGFLIFHLKNRFDYYRSNPATLNMEVVPNDTLVFPAITICNSSPFKASNLAANNESELGNIFSGVANVDWSQYNLSHINWTDFHIRNGFQLEELLFWCNWKKTNCTKHDFTPIITETGLCYQFNAGGEEHLHLETQGSGYGFGMTLLAKQRDYVSYAYPAGFLIIIHSPGDHPDINLGTLISSGGFTGVSLKLKRLINLPPPHGKCGEKPLVYYNKYSKANCHAECFHNFTLKKCGCRLTHFPRVPGYRECSPEDSRVCVDNLKLNITETVYLRECGCKTPCDSFKYDISLSSAKISEAAMRTTAAILRTTQEAVSQDFLSVFIYYSEMSYEEVVQQKAYSALALLSDIGGALGLVLGSTLMTLAEVVDFFFGLCFWKLFGVEM